MPKPRVLPSRSTMVVPTDRYSGRYRNRNLMDTERQTPVGTSHVGRTFMRKRGGGRGSFLHNTNPLTMHHGAPTRPTVIGPVYVGPNTGQDQYSGAVFGPATAITETHFVLAGGGGSTYDHQEENAQGGGTQAWVGGC